ncbi:flagellar basal body P-ring protein FlgI [Thermoproteota archaeon]
MKKIITLFCLILILASVSMAESLPVRLKDIGKIIEARDNQLIGYGLVVGLRNSGDTSRTPYTEMALTNLLKRLGIAPTTGEFRSRNVASVMVTATLPPFLKRGQRIPVIVSSLGDCSSLVGGTLLMTPLQGADLQTYAMAQGPVIVGGVSEKSTQSQFLKNQSTVGRIPQGAIIEAEVPITFRDQHHITIVLNDSNFITVSRATEAIKGSGFPSAKAIDANTIKIPLTDLNSSDLVSSIAKLENITLIPDAPAKVVINSRTGTVVIGEMVRLFPVALTHGNISVRIAERTPGAGFGLGTETQAGVEVEENPTKIIYLNPSTTLSSLVNALNEIGATPKDLISIIQALKESGALIANVEII